MWIALHILIVIGVSVHILLRGHRLPTSRMAWLLVVILVPYAGALAYLLKAASGEELANAIRTVMRGDALLDPAVTRKVMAQFARLSSPTRPVNAGLVDPLTEREVEVLRALADGLSNREIADRLFLAEGTVKNYVTNILGKIGVRDRTQAALRGRELGLL